MHEIFATDVDFYRKENRMVSAKKTSPTESATAGAEHSAALDLESDALVEEISIDGMCGVY